MVSGMGKESTGCAHEKKYYLSWVRGELQMVERYMVLSFWMVG